jgi:hypothetical protein
LTKNDLDIQSAGPAGVWQQFTAKKAVAMAAVPDWTATAIAAGAKVDIVTDKEWDAMERYKAEEAAKLAAANPGDRKN